jgi:hypothetical protein
VLIATQLMNLVFVPLLGVAGLALSIGLGACINAAVPVHRPAPPQDLHAARRLAGLLPESGARGA